MTLEKYPTSLHADSVHSTLDARLEYLRRAHRSASRPSQASTHFIRTGTDIDVNRYRGHESWSLFSHSTCSPLQY